MEFCTKLQQRIVDLENTKTAQAQEITSLKLRVNKLEKKGGSRTHKLKRLYKVGRSARVISSDEASLGDQEDASKQGRIADIDADAGINLVSTHFDADTNMFGVHDLVGDEVVVETEVASKDVNLSVDEVTLAQALVALKSAKPKADKVMLQEPEQGTITTTTAATTVTAASTRPKAKGLVIHEEEQATTPTVSSQQPSQLKDNVPAMIDADYKMAQQMKAEEQEKLSIEEKSKLFVQPLGARNETHCSNEMLKKMRKQTTKTKSPKRKYIVYLFEIHGWIQTIRSVEEQQIVDIQNTKHGSRPEEGYERVLWGDLKTKRLIPHVEGQSTFIEEATYAHSYAGRKEISPYTGYNHRYAKLEAAS
ncbi:hypothetical protein Tco_0465648 [Tanacetum coccineum]